RSHLCNNPIPGMLPPRSQWNVSQRPLEQEAVCLLIPYLLVPPFFFAKIRGEPSGSSVSSRCLLFLRFSVSPLLRFFPYSLPGPHQYIAILINGQPLGLDDLGLHIFEKLVIEIEFALQRPIRYSPLALEPGKRLRYYFEKLHPPLSLPGMSEFQ